MSAITALSGAPAGAGGQLEISTGAIIAGAPAVGSAGLPAAPIGVMVMLIAGLLGCIVVVDGMVAGAERPALLVITGDVLAGSALPRPATAIPAPATPLAGSVLVAPACATAAPAAA